MCWLVLLAALVILALVAKYALCVSLIVAGLALWLFVKTVAWIVGKII